MPMHRFLGAALLCGVTLAAAAPASAATQKTADVGFFIAPVGTPSLRFAAEPGRTVDGRVRIQNLSQRPRTIELAATDLVTADTGGASFPATAPDAVGTWLQIDRPRVRLAGREAAVVRFRVTVPPSASPGEHYAGIVAVDAAQAAASKKPGTARDSVEIRHLARLALPVRLTLPGPLASRLALTEMRFSVDASGSSLRVGLENNGTRIVRATDMDLEVSHEGRRLLTVENEIRDFITGSSISYPVAWRGALKPGSYQVSGTISPHGGPVLVVDQTVDFTPKLAETLEQKTGTPAAPADGQPVWIWALLVLAIVAVGTTATAYLRLRRRLDAASMNA